jgi:hypothetical protein
MFALGRKATCAQVNSASALPSTADIQRQLSHVGLGPKADKRDVVWATSLQLSLSEHRVFTQRLNNRVNSGPARVAMRQCDSPPCV